MKRTVSYLVVFSYVVVIGMGLAQAQQHQAKPAAAPAALAPAMDSEMAKAMAAVQQVSTPGEAHKALEPFVGTWTYTAQWWITPDGKPQSMTGTSVNTLIFGGRFLKEEIRGEAKDQPPFEGIGLTGYDNMRKEYQTIWFDNMATGIMVGSGQFEGAAKGVTAAGDFSCPITGETHRKFRSVWTAVDPNHNTYESYMSGPEGKEFKSMEIRYTRQGVPCPPATERC